MFKLLFLILTILVFVSAKSAERKNIGLSKITDRVEVDGQLNEPFWAGAQIATNFIQTEPIAGEASSQRTEVRIAFDDQAIYISAELFDLRDSMTRVLSQRDDVSNTDWFGVVFDTYNSGTIGFGFIVSIAGVQLDHLHQVDDVDNNWNAVWQSAVQILDDRWVVEMKIPFSAIRFPSDVEQIWGINFARNIQRKREESFWNFFDPTGINIISQLGQLTGIHNIDSPIRLSLYPYVSGYVERDGASKSVGFSGSGGMDVKYGLNESFTLDLTLIPDFGQVQFDNNVLNLSPFEVRYNERRQFFTEGTELFNKGDLFYSRRIGGSPINYYDAYTNLDSTEIVESNPSSTRLINATKFSGRTNSGLGIGVFNAITSNSYATIYNTLSGARRNVLTNPFSNYNVLVFDQNLKNNSSVTLVNTSVLRNGETYDANVTSGAYSLFTKGQKYQTYGQFALSQIYAGNSVDLGHLANFGFGKAAGNFAWNLDYFESSQDYDPNDLGYFYETNQRTVSAEAAYNIYEPFWKLYRMWTSFDMSYTRNVSPDDFANFDLGVDIGGTFKNFMTAGMWLFSEPIITYDFYEPRVQGRFYEYPRTIGAGGFLSSNYGKPFSLDMRTGYILFDDPGRYNFDLTTSPRFRMGDRLFVILTNVVRFNKNEEGAALDNNFDLPFVGVDPIFGIRDRFTTENIITASYIFNNKMGITFGLRHYWSKVNYDQFFVLDADGRLQPTTYTGMDSDNKSIHNNSYNSFTIDMAYRWIFAPGSELSLVWKNSIFSFSEETQNNYFENVNDLMTNPATNSISLKLLYYINYWTVKQKFSKKK